MNNRPDMNDDVALPEEGGREPDSLEQALPQALRREEAPAGFADRVMARAAAGDLPTAAALPRTPSPESGSQAGRPAKVISWPARRLWVRGAIAAALVLGIFEAESTWRRIREEQRRIAEATAQFQTTERVTVRALAQAREQLQRAGVPLSFD